MNLPTTCGSPNKASAFTLVETVMSLLVAGVIFSGVFMAYVQSARFAEWSGYSMAAQALSLQLLEQARSAKWDTQAVPEVDETTNILSSAYGIALDVPQSGTNIVYADCFISIANMPDITGSGIRLKVIQVDTVWPYRDQLFTNTTATLLAPDR